MRRRFFIVIASFCAILLLAGCAGFADSDIPETLSGSAQDKLLEKYQTAADAVYASGDFTLLISTETKTTVGADVFTEASQQTLCVMDFGTEDMSASMTETLTIGSYSTSICEAYSDGTGYFSVDGTVFTSSMTADEYLRLYAPAALLDPALYSQILSAKQDDTTIIQFQQAAGSETWAVPEKAQLEEASGQAVLDKGGNLVSCSYCADYTYGAASVSLSVTVTVDTAPVSITLPGNTGSSVTLEYPNAVRMLEKACGYLRQASSVTAQTTNSIACQAGGDYLSRYYTLNMYEEMSLLELSLDLISYSAGGAVTHYEQTERFQNGVYSITENDGDAVTRSDIASETMRTYCQDILLESILLPEYITTAEIADLGSTYLLEFTGSEKLAQLICENACVTLYENGDLLNDLASAYVTNTISCYISIDKYTGLPTASGLNYSGTHTIEGYGYLLNVQTDQAYTLGSLSAEEAITGEAALSDAQPTPLFYQVTGEDGQQMWLLGTIHVGDAQTSNLPDEIYNALTGSAALAVEYDTIAFNDQLETDSELQMEVSGAYYYADGTTAADHLDSLLYESALDLMKASGNYSTTVNSLKPSLWETCIANFYVKQGYSLTAENGVDTRLLQLAKASNIEIRSIESGLSQAQMLGGFSDEIQELLLESIVSTDALDYIQQTQELYDKWCQGDEAALRELLRTDLSGFTEAEAAVYSEYNRIMLTDRNEAMLEAAVQYLESGETVFYAVGLAHLLDDNGLVNALRGAGYTVTQVTYQ